jgi:hypothetical protein
MTKKATERRDFEDWATVIGVGTDEVKTAWQARIAAARIGRRETWQSGALTTGDAASDFRTREEIEAAIQYYLNYREEIERDRQHSRALYEAHAPKRQTVLA